MLTHRDMFRKIPIISSNSKTSHQPRIDHRCLQGVVITVDVVIDQAVVVVVVDGGGGVLFWMNPRPNWFFSIFYTQSSHTHTSPISLSLSSLSLSFVHQKVWVMMMGLF